MTTKFFNLAQMTTATTGAGTVTLGLPTTNYRSFAAAGAMTGDIVPYSILDGSSSECGVGTLTIAGSVTTMTRTLTGSTTGALLNLSGGAIVSLTPRAEDLRKVQRLATATPFTVSLTDDYIVINQTIAGVATINLPSAAARGGQPVVIMDGNGSGLTYNHIVAVNGTDVIAGGGASFVFYSNYQSQEFVPVLIGSQWTWLVR